MTLMIVIATVALIAILSRLFSKPKPVGPPPSPQERARQVDLVRRQALESSRRVVERAVGRMVLASLPDDPGK